MSIFPTAAEAKRIIKENKTKEGEKRIKVLQAFKNACLNIDESVRHAKDYSLYVIIDSICEDMVIESLKKSHYINVKVIGRDPYGSITVQFEIPK